MFLLLNLLASVVIPGMIPVLLIAALAGRWDLWSVWAFAGISTGSLVVQTLIIFRKSPDLLKARMVDAGGRVRLRADRAFIVLCILQWIIVGLDQHFHWSDIVSSMGIVAGLVIAVLSWVLTTWAVSANPFFSPAVRIQEERGQRVVRAGPYAFMRHPGYAGIALSMFAGAMALNSLLSLIPAILYLAVTLRQTRIEDQMLCDELAGYADYAAMVRYRLIPGIW